MVTGLPKSAQEIFNLELERSVSGLKDAYAKVLAMEDANVEEFSFAVLALCRCATVLYGVVCAGVGMSMFEPVVEKKD